MPDASVLRAPIAGCENATVPALERSSQNGGPDTAWIRVIGERENAIAPQLERLDRFQL